MALSGSTNYSVNRDELIGHVYRNILGATPAGQSPTANEISDATVTLNMMLKAWQADGLQLWVTKEAVLIPELNKQSYSLGLTGDHCSLSMQKTEVKVASIATDVNLDVDSTANIAASDNIGIVLDDGMIHWTAILSITDSDTVVLTTGLPSAASVGNHVYNYTSKIDRPNELLEVYRREYDSSIDVPIIKLSRTEFFTLSDKNSSGTPVNYYYDPQLTNTKLNVWQTANSSFASNSVFRLVIKKPFDDMDSAADDFEFPQEWYEAVSLGLGKRLAGSIGMPIVDRQVLRKEAAEAKEDAMNFDAEGGSVTFAPGYE